MRLGLLGAGLLLSNPILSRRAVLRSSVLAILGRASRLLFLAWYAIIPPVMAGAVDARVPIGQWEQVRAFDKAEDCERVMGKYAAEMAAQTDNAAQERHRRVQYVRCVSASDPRLKP